MSVIRRPSHVVRRSSFFGECGYSLIELLLAVLILVIALVPLMDSITASFQHTHAGEENTLLINLTRAKMDDVLAMSFDTIPLSSPQGSPTALSDTVTVLGNTVNRDVLVELYDGDGDTIPDSTLKKITVVTAYVQLESLLFDE